MSRCKTDLQPGNVEGKGTEKGKVGIQAAAVTLYCGSGLTVGTGTLKCNWTTKSPGAWT